MTAKHRSLCASSLWSDSVSRKRTALSCTTSIRLDGLASCQSCSSFPQSPAGEKHLVSDPADAVEMPGAGIGKLGDAVAVGEGGRVAATDNPRAERQMDFVHEIGFEQSGVDLSAAFAEQVADVPFRAQPAERSTEVELFPAEDLHCVRQRFQLMEPALGDARGGQDDDRAEGPLKQARGGIDMTSAADDNTEGQSGGLRSTDTGFAGAQIGVDVVDRGGAAQNGVRVAAEFEEQFKVAPAAEGINRAIGGRDLAVGGHGEVQTDERAIGR